MAGLACIATMYLFTSFDGLTPLPQLTQDLVIRLVPGRMFGYLIDQFQHRAIVLEEAGLLVAFVGLAGVTGAAYFFVRRRSGWALAPMLGLLLWAPICLVLLPINGEGLLGLNDGPTTPMLWAVTAVVFAVIVEVTYRGTHFTARSAAPAVTERRRFILLGALAISGLSTGYILSRLGPRWLRLASAAPEDLSVGVPTTALTPASEFYVVSKDFLDPMIVADRWALTVQGLVDKPVRLSLTDLKQMSSSEYDVTLECISNPVGGRLISTGHFKGVPLRVILNTAGIQPEAVSAAFLCRDDYKELVPLDFIASNSDILVAYELNGAPLPPSHGFPARLVIPGHYGMKSPKWLDTVDVTTDVTGAYYEMLGWGWQDQAVVRTMSRFDVPVDRSARSLGPVPMAGVAFAGRRGISKVEISADGGRNWQSAELEPRRSAFTWALWTTTWLPLDVGQYRLQVRAFDGNGAVQPASDQPSFPDGASGYHTISVSIRS